jgi:acyl carrier protein
MQLEEDLGYTISAETLTQFSKIRHYVNYIGQVEGFKKENNGKAPLA